MIDLSAIDNLGIDRVLRRKTAETVEQNEKTAFVYDAVSGAYMLACEDAAEGLSVLDRHRDRGYRLLMTSDVTVGREAFSRYGFSEKLECFQAAYHGAVPSVGSSLEVREADESDLPFLTENYSHISPAEMEQVVSRRSMLIGYAGKTPVGFIGEHLEGSMGLLYILPEFRRRGYAEALEKTLIKNTLQSGFVPFCQVEKDNSASLALQRKIGMTVSDRLICWMWKQ